jgi:2-polyprenyl-3-methyl-5-hydroxy-6-metoxy-1,4-benzoquinol methylase
MSWNHNDHYHQLIIGIIAPDCQSALDVGCGQGALTRRLRQLIPHVTGMDRDERSIALARAQAKFPDIRYLQADFLAESVEPGSFDLVTSVASLHHMDAEAALRKMADVLRPGGVLVVIGLARDFSPTNFALIVPAMIGNWMHRAAAAWSRRASPGAAGIAYQSPVIWPPATTYRQARRLAERILPGVQYRRRLYWRYSLVWHKPGED